MSDLPDPLWEFEKPLKEPGEDGLPWGFVDEAGQWHRLPKTPMLLNGLGPPPFKVRLPSGDYREVVHQPTLL